MECWQSFLCMRAKFHVHPDVVAFSNHVAVIECLIVGMLLWLDVQVCAWNAKLGVPGMYLVCGKPFLTLTGLGFTLTVCWSVGLMDVCTLCFAVRTLR